MPAPQVNITLGTAGHIDHGKTAMVKLLTGCETDRLKEEKERGMSIELGFAPCLVAGQEVGIVDVPGHEHFIKTMVAGATGMDGVILVVAADDGIMLQTREHLDILTLLGIRHGIVALTKIDRVPADRREQVRQDLGRFLAGTFLEGAPILPVSNVTGEGYDGLLKALKALVASIHPRPADGVFRVPVERIFSVKGYGTVVTGIPITGSVHLGDEVVLLPQGLPGRVTGLQVYGRDADTAFAGQCTAMNIRHWDAKAVQRGNVLTVPGYFAPAEFYVCRLRLLPHETFALKNAAKAKFHAGTSEVPATVYLLGGDRLRAGEEGMVQVRLEEPIVAGPADPFILRTASPPMTVGGGIIVEATPRRLRRSQPGLAEDLARRADAVSDLTAFTEYCLATAESVAVAEEDLAHRINALPARLQQILADLVDAGRVIRLGAGFAVHRDVADATEKRIVAAIETFHRASPESPGLDFDGLLEATALAKHVAEGLLARLKASGRVEERHGRLALAEHRQTLADADRQAMQSVEALFRERAFTPPGEDEAAMATGLPPADVAKAVRLLAEQQHLVQVAPGLLFHREAVDRAQQMLVDFIRKEGQMESVKFKYLLDTTRKFAIPLLDYFDRVGVTRAVGHTRYLRAAHRGG